MDLLDEGIIHSLSGIESGSKNLPDTTQNGTQLKTYELFLELSIYYVRAKCE